MKDRSTQDQPATVPLAKQAGEVRARWAWTEETIWTERMLVTLETGVKGGKWFSLIDKVYAPENLRSAFAKVKRNRGAAGVDHQTIEMFEHNLGENLGKLSRQLREGSYEPQPVQRRWIPKAGGGERPLGIPTVRDRVVQQALRHAIEPIFEKTFAEHSYGFRPQRGCKDALRRVDALLKRGYVHVVDADLKSYFDTIPRESLMTRLGEQISDGRVLELLRGMLGQDIMEGASRWTPEGGTPQGAVISPLLANVYLTPLDHLMASKGMEMVRYADDLVVLCHSREEAQEALEALMSWVQQAGLTLHAEKTRLVDARERGGFDFLGYHFERGYRWPRKKSLQKLKDQVRSQTKRTNGKALEQIIETVNRTLRAWFEYFKHAHRTTFPRLDAWVRARLRRILRKRNKKRGYGKANAQWPNAYFKEAGLLSLTTAHAACASPQAR